MNKDRNIADRLATWLPVIAVVFVVLNVIVWAVKWTLDPIHLFAVYSLLTSGAGAAMIPRKTRKAGTIAILMLAVFFVPRFFSVMVDNAIRQSQTAPAVKSLTGTASGGMATATGGGVIR